MMAKSAVGIHDDLPAGHAAISEGTASDKPTSGIYEKLCFLIDHFRGDNLFYHLFNDPLPQRIVINLGGVLGRYNNGRNSNRSKIYVPDCHLRFSIWPQPRELAGFADMGKPLREVVGKINGHGHKNRGVSAGIPEHEPLIACSPFLKQPGAVNALSNVR